MSIISQNQATPLIIQHHENQAAQTGAATVNSLQNAQENIVKVNNQMDVKITGEPVNINVDGERLATVTMRYSERHEIREGGGN